MIWIRQAHAGDVPEMVRLDQLIFASYGADESPDTIRARVMRFPRGCAVLVDDETEAGSITGYLTTEKWAQIREPALDEDPYFTHDPSGQILNITTLAIDPDFQGRGLGRQLVEYALQLARDEGCTTIILETAHAADFYRTLGFEPAGERQERNIRLHILQYHLADV